MVKPIIETDEYIITKKKDGKYQIDFKMKLCEWAELDTVNDLVNKCINRYKPKRGDSLHWDDLSYRKIKDLLSSDKWETTSRADYASMVSYLLSTIDGYTHDEDVREIFLKRKY